MSNPDIWEHETTGPPPPPLGDGMSVCAPAGHEKHLELARSLAPASRCPKGKCKRRLFVCEIGWGILDR